MQKRLIVRLKSVLVVSSQWKTQQKNVPSETAANSTGAISKEEQHRPAAKRDMEQRA